MLILLINTALFWRKYSQQQQQQQLTQRSVFCSGGSGFRHKRRTNPCAVFDERAQLIMMCYF